MGFGDDIMATADARRIYAETGQQVVFGDGKNWWYEQQVFRNNPKISSTGKGIWVPNYPGNRPYAFGTRNGRLIYDYNFQAEAGELFLDGKIENGDYILVEPNTKPDYKSGINKSWYYWNDLLKNDLPWRINGSPTFWDALHVLAGASLYVGTDGGLHHAAAALGIPSVIIWTGYSSPQHLGYKSHVNIHDGSEPCGSYEKECPHCKKKSLAISVEQVLKAIDSEYARSGAF